MGSGAERSCYHEGSCIHLCFNITDPMTLPAYHRTYTSRDNRGSLTNLFGPAWGDKFLI